MLVYPAIGMDEPMGTWRIETSPAWRISDSCARQTGLHRPRVDSKTPPCFLVHAADDSGVPVRNSLEFAARCAENKVPVVRHFFAQGGHGFGLKGKGDSVSWPDPLKAWLASSKLANGS